LIRGSIFSLKQNQDKTQSKIQIKLRTQYSHYSDLEPRHLGTGGPSIDY